MTATRDAARRDATWAERGATSALFFALGVYTGGWAASLAAIKAALSLSDTMMSVALLAFAGGSTAATVVSGVIAARLGTRRATTLGALVMGVGLLLPPLAPSLLALSGAALVAGLAMGLYDVSLNGHASAIETRWGAPVMSSFHGAFSLGGLAGAALGGALAGHGAPVQLGIPVAFGLALTLVAMPWLGTGAPATADAGRPSLALPERALVSLGIIAAFCFVVEGAMGDWSAIYLDSVLGSGLALAAAGYAAFSVAMAATRLSGDAAVAAFGPRAVLVGGGLIAGMGLLLAVLVPVPLAAACGFALVGLGLGNVAPIAFSAAARAGSTPAAGVAPVATLGYGGFLFGPPIVGFLSGLAGLRGALACLVLATLAIAALGAQLSGRRSRT